MNAGLCCKKPEQECGKNRMLKIEKVYTINQLSIFYIRYDNTMNFTKKENMMVHRIRVVKVKLLYCTNRQD